MSVPAAESDYFPDNGDAAYDVVHYDLRLTYRIETNRLEGRASVHAVARRGLDELRLDLAGLDVRRVTVDVAQVAKFSVKRGRLVVRLRGIVEPGQQFRVDVRYDGPDLPEVARLLGRSEAAVVAAHTGRVWTVAFCGFVPGFGYLVADGARLEVPRRAESRTRVPAGSVALAGEYSGVYPTASPGGVWGATGSTGSATDAALSS